MPLFFILFFQFLNMSWAHALPENTSPAAFPDQIFIASLDSQNYNISSPITITVPSLENIPQIYPSLFAQLENHVKTHAVSKRIFTAYPNTYGNRYLKYQIDQGYSDIPEDRRPFFLLLDPASAANDPWNYFYATLFDPRILAKNRHIPDGQMISDDDVMDNFDAYLWGIYQQKPGATGTGSDGPSTLSKKLSDIELKQAFRFFCKKLKLKFIWHSLIGYEASILEINNVKDSDKASPDSHNIYNISLGFSPMGGYVEYGYSMQYDASTQKILSRKFEIQKLTPDAIEYNNELRKKYGNPYRAKPSN